MGLPASDFWSQTMRLYVITMKAKGRAADAAQYNRAWLAWHIAAIPLMAKFPTLAELTGVRPQIKKQTPAEARAMFAAWREAA